MNSTTEKIHRIIIDQLGVEENEIIKTASFEDDLGADSLDMVELMMSCEESFDIKIPDEDAEKIKTVGNLQDYIKTKIHKD